MNRRNFKRRGFLLLDAGVSIALITALLFVLGFAMSACGKYNRYNLVKQRCLAACRGQLESITVRGKAIDEETMRRLWEDVEVSVERSDGRGQWEGLELVRVRALGKAGRRSVEISIERYIAGEPGQVSPDREREFDKNDSETVGEADDA